jgi:hypothetical protein
MISQQTKSLLDRVPDHPLAATVKGAMIDALTASEHFVRRRGEIASNGMLTADGQRQALRDELTSKFIKAVARAGEPIAKVKRDVEARRDKLVIKAIDPTNVVAELQRQEIRAYLRTLDLRAKQVIAKTTNDTRLLEAMVTAPPELSGMVGAHLGPLAEEIEARYLELTYGPEIAEITAIEAVLAEADAGMQVARQSLQTNSEMTEYEFNRLAAPIEKGVGRPWLLKSGTKPDGSDRIMVVSVNNGVASYHEATDEQRAAGVYYKDAAEYSAAQGAAA